MLNVYDVIAIGIVCITVMSVFNSILQIMHTKSVNDTIRKSIRETLSSLIFSSIQYFDEEEDDENKRD